MIPDHERIIFYTSNLLYTVHAVAYAIISLNRNFYSEASWVLSISLLQINPVTQKGKSEYCEAYNF